MPKFVVDHMVGKLARWLRILGFDTLLATANDDDQAIVKLVENEDRILLTRDTKIVARKALNNRYLLLQHQDLKGQLQEVIKELNLQIEADKFFSRCLLCNTELIELTTEQAKDKVPAAVLSYYHEFWYCPLCQKAFWCGSHYDRMVRTITEVLTESIK